MTDELSRRRLLATGGVFAAASLTAGPARSHAASARRAGALAGPAVTRIGDTTLDPSGLYFLSYDGLVNIESFQLSGILTHGSRQYAAWYTSSRHAVLARRSLPGGAWQSFTLPHQLSTNDSHNVISLGVSPADGRLHVAMDTHNSTIWYTRSAAGQLGDAAWSAGRFETLQRTLGGLSLGSITYPQFVLAPNGRLQLSYRTGGSGNGVNRLAEYDGSWRALGAWSGATGSYTARGVTSTTRNMYLHGLTYDTRGRLHAAFTWREGNSGVLCAAGGLANHDTGYVYSDDQGRTWRNSAGTQVGTTGGTPVSVGSPGLVADPMTVDHGLMNQEAQAADSAGRPHVIISYVPGRFTQCVSSYAAQRTSYARAFHVRRDASGTWRKTEIPFALNSTGRSRLVFDASDNAYVVLPFARIVAASAESGWSDWRMLFDGAGLNAFGECTVDYPRVAAEQVLSVMFQQRSSGTAPSPVRVTDFRLGV
ncbi:BNR repeat-containing protein [Sphaerisporangium sp. TRM90804]|uniref:BNR repeat-containing protein n=1 Tax=Sphaerisporangium sp. TRM90804 TaxID=3031113 RepID=UPI00244A61B8|nr:BNR repeat-containing protein [Sphaerisporangium sp. TRM90804]MDH2428420.1 BNR repeat-containing protein [Sphaerisporangium sp. TRM90804]